MHAYVISVGLAVIAVVLAVHVWQQLVAGRQTKTQDDLQRRLRVKGDQYQTAMEAIALAVQNMHAASYDGDPMRSRATHDAIWEDLVVTLIKNSRPDATWMQNLERQQPSPLRPVRERFRHAADGSCYEPLDDL